MKSRHSNVCVICGTRPSTTKDHVPPKSIFPKPRPSNLIKVPACKECNNESSVYDERFKVYIGIMAGHGKEGESLLDQTIGTLKNNHKLLLQIMNATREAEFMTPGGIIWGKGHITRPDSEAHDKIVERIIRALHWRHTGNILGDSVNVKIYWNKNITSLFNGWLTNMVGDRQFIYSYIAFKEQPFSSAWVFNFFDKGWSSGLVLPKYPTENL